MEMNALWDVGLTAGLGFIVWWAKSQHDELRRVQILLNRIESEGDGNITVFYLIVVGLSIVAMALVSAVLIGFYYLIYGLLLKRLKSNYKDLKELETES